MECVYSQSTSEHGVSKPICQKNLKSSPPKPFMGRLKLFKNAFKPTIAEDVTSFKNYPGWILGYKYHVWYCNVEFVRGFILQFSILFCSFIYVLIFVLKCIPIIYMQSLTYWILSCDCGEFKTVVFDLFCVYKCKPWEYLFARS